MPKANWKHARDMRKDPTRAEQVLWEALRGYRTEIKFRRQHLIGRFIADFYAPDRRLVIEIDGDVHLESQRIERDKERTAAFETLGYRVIRFTNDEVLNDTQRVVDRILREVDRTCDPP